MLHHFPHLNGRAAMFRSPSLYGYLKQVYTSMYQYWMKQDMYYKPLCEGMLLEVLARLHQDRNEQQYSGKQIRAVREVRDYILSYYREPLSIEELTLLSGRRVNASHLISSFKKHFGLAPLEYMHKTRISKAKELLLETRLTLDTIADELGYCDASYFNRMFKKMAGVTPSAYRKSNIP